ncbi:glycosyltransferase [Salinibacterium sp. ZJ70]|uniref:glycosyltransferase n=1 Tax=Salinibacterium sp. ZJ70 TaxID=2708084 RepID=UPI0014207B63|nr:glycosyltransferase [Salinibacterium sp. ZJ70]
MPRVTAILVVQDGARWLDGTLGALAGLDRRPDSVVLVAEPSLSFDPDALAAAGITQVVTATGGSYGDAVARALSASPAQGSDEWLWLLRADTAPAPDALRALLVAVELAPSVVIAGPKLVDFDETARIRSYGVTVSPLGATVNLVDDELDQAQYDNLTDVMAVDVAGSLVRRDVWAALGGVDAGLPTTDAGLDLGIRARLAGHRVVRVPEARVAVARRPEDLGRRKPANVRVRRRIARTAQLHRRLVYAPALAVPLHWLSLLPLALIRVVGDLLGKRPGDVPGEIGAALRAAFDGSIWRARLRLARSRKVSWRTLAPLRMRGAALREHRAHERDQDDERAGREPDLVRASFLGGGSWVVALALITGVVALWRLIGATNLEGGALAPLAGSAGELWSRVGWGEREIGVSFLGAADPASVLWAILGSLTWWDPSFSLVLLWLLALPLAALGAWWAATRLSERVWPPVIAALLWSLAPAFLVALGEGRPGAVLVHILLPWLVLALIESVHSWSAAAAAALLFAGVTAASPILLLPLVLLVVAWALARPRGFARIIGVLIPAAALFAPLVIDAFRRGSPLAVFADPGLVVPSDAPSGWGLVIGRPEAGSGGWDALLAELGVESGIWSTIVPAALLTPLAALALLALFLPGARRSIPALVVATVGLATAWISTQLHVVSLGPDVVGPWAGAPLSLYWIGLVGAAVVALDALGRATGPVGVLALAAAVLAVLPALAAPVFGSSPVHPGDGRTLPALAAVVASEDPGVGTLVLTPYPDGTLGATLQRGDGATLDDQSALHAGRTQLADDELALAELAGNLASRGGYDPAPELQRQQIRFVLVEPLPASATEEATAVRERAVAALDASPDLAAESDSGYGTLWSFGALERTRDAPADGGAYGTVVLAVQAIIALFALLLAIPTRRRRRVVQTSSLVDEPVATTFDEDTDG